jgi:hypothetical protein
MPPSLEVVNSLHHHGHHDGDFDDAILKASIEEDLDITETESSETCDQPTEARIINGEDWNHITKPGNHDVLLGRGGGTNNHSGNIKFRKLVNEHKMRYLACSKVEKPKVARQVVALWRKMEPTGRFLTRKDESKRGPGSVKASDNVWYEVGDKKAREKASQCLRERTPDVIPYIKHLREQQNAITEQGVSMVQMQMQQQEMLHQSPHQPHHGHHPAVNMSSPHHPMHQQHPSSAGASYGGHTGFDPQSSPYAGAGPMSPSAAFPRRNSMPTPPARRGSLPVPPPLGTNFSPHQPPRRSSLPMNGMMMMAPDMGGFPVDEQDFMSPADMSEIEYQQQMMMMQQQMMQQQMQMQRMQQNRVMQNRMRMQGMDASMNGSMNGMSMRGAAAAEPYGHMDNNQVYAHDPLLTGSNGQVEHSKNKRGRGDDDEDKKVAPDRTTSLMSLTPANPHDNELSLEDYRQQLEEYIANSNNAPNEDGDDGNESDLEDDWEKERERAVMQQQERKKELGRGVNRNVSGMSCLSTKSTGMSLVSGFSGFSDMNMSKASKTDRENKMNMARSVCSNLSLMSDMTDLSQNIDNLSIYDD